MDPRADRQDPGQYIGDLVKVNKVQKAKFDLAIEGRSTASTRAFTAGEKERTKANSIFLSTTERFNDLEKSHPNVRVLNPEKNKNVSMDESKLNNSLMKASKNLERASEKCQYDFKDTRT